MNISKAIGKADIEQQKCFDINWLKVRGLKSSFKNNKIKVLGNIAKFLNKFTPTNATWNGHNSSAWKEDILAVNGFDERMQYGGEDRELGERMFNNGIKSKQIRYSAICLHLDHARGYVKPEMIQTNRAIRNNTKPSVSLKPLLALRKIVYSASTEQPEFKILSQINFSSFSLKKFGENCSYKCFQFFFKVLAVLP